MKIPKLSLSKATLKPILVLCGVILIVVLTAILYKSKIIQILENKHYTAQIITMSRDKEPVKTEKISEFDLKSLYKGCSGAIIEFHKLDMSNKEDIRKKLIGKQFFPFGFASDEISATNNPWNILLKSNDGWFFVNNTDKGMIAFEIRYDLIRDSVFTGTINRLNLSHYSPYIVAIDLHQKYFVHSDTTLSKIDTMNDNTNDKGETQLIRSKSSTITGICLSKSGQIAMQSVADNQNIISFLPNIKTENFKSVTFGKPPMDCYDVIWAYYPIDLDSKNDNIAFIADMNDESDTKVDSHIYQKNLWLCVLDKKSGKTSKVFPIDNLTTFNPDSLKWCPDRNRNLIAVCVRGSVMLIDVPTGEKIREIKTLSPIIRWSPDGTMLGIMGCDGILYSYDINSLTLTKVDENPNNFNFFWVE